MRKIDSDIDKLLQSAAPGINRGFFIVIEGIDGAGKTSLCQLLCEKIAQLDLKALYAKEPTNGYWGLKIRDIAAKGRAGISPEEELEYFVRDRAEDVENNILPALLAGRPVVCDRYILSNIAYQSSLGLSEHSIIKANKHFPQPDLTFIIDIPVEAALKRICSSRTDGANQGFEQKDFLLKVQKVFNAQNGPKIIRLDGLQSLNQLADTIISTLRSHDMIYPEKLSIIDTHCHLRMEEFKDVDQVLQRALDSGVTAILDIGLNADHGREVLERAAPEKGIYPVLGWHPHDVENLDEKGLQELMSLASHRSVVGFGEIGLDYCLMRSSQKKQLWAFERLLEMAADLNLPVSIHSRDAFDDTVKMLKKYSAKLKRGGVIHCFTLGWEEAQQYLDLNFHLSFPGVITFPKSDELRTAARLAPADKILIETDAPYMAPAPMRGYRNEPCLLVWHLRALAQARSISVIEAARLCTNNARSLFNI